MSERSERLNAPLHKRSAWRATAPSRETYLRGAIGIEFREVLRLEMDADTWAAIMDDNPGEFLNRINGTYPGKRPLSTVPPNILARLPRLPHDVQYRFLGRHLILHDTRANLILDRVPYAIRCADCDSQPATRHPEAREMSRSPVPVTTSSAQFCRPPPICDGPLLAIDSCVGDERP